MATFALTGSDSIQVGGRVLKNFADGDIGKVAFDNDLANVKTGKNGNAVFAANAPGVQATVDLRLIRGSSDDNYLTQLLGQQIADLASFELLDGVFVKRLGDGQGNIQNDTYIGAGGIFGKMPEVTSNTDGSTDQGVAMWRLKYASFRRQSM